jgi:hypothetical protein
MSGISRGELKTICVEQVPEGMGWRMGKKRVFLGFREFFQRITLGFPRVLEGFFEEAKREGAFSPGKQGLFWGSFCRWLEIGNGIDHDGSGFWELGAWG